MRPRPVHLVHVWQCLPLCVFVYHSLLLRHTLTNQLDSLTNQSIITWSKVVSCFYADNQLPKRMEFYDEKGRKVRRIAYDEVKMLGGRLAPTRMTLTPLSEDKRGNETVVSFDAMEFDVEVNSTTFSEANLRRGR